MLARLWHAYLGLDLARCVFCLSEGEESGRARRRHVGLIQEEKGDWKCNAWN